MDNFQWTNVLEWKSIADMLWYHLTVRWLAAAIECNWWYLISSKRIKTREIDRFFGFKSIHSHTTHSILLRFIFFYSFEVFFCCVNLTANLFFPSSLLRHSVCGCVISIKMMPSDSEFQLNLCSMTVLIHALNKLETHKEHRAQYQTTI